MFNLRVISAILVFICTLSAQQPEVILSLPWSSGDTGISYSILPEGYYGPQAFKIFDQKIYILDNQNCQIKVFQEQKLVQSYLTPPACYDFSIYNKEIIVHDGHRVWLIKDDNINQVYIARTASIIKRVNIYSGEIFLEFSNGDLARLDPVQKKSTLYQKGTSFFPVTEKLSKTRARIYSYNAVNKTDFYIDFPGNDLASIRLLGMDKEGRLYLNIERFIQHVPLKIEREVRQYTSQGSLLNRLIIPAKGYVFIENDLTVTDDARLYYLYSTQDSIKIISWDLSEIYDSVIQFKAYHEPDDNTKTGLQEKTICEKELLFGISDFPQVTPDEALLTGDTYVQLNWVCGSENITYGLITDIYGYQVETPSWVTPGAHEKVPYKWGGFQTLAQFLDGLINGKYAGDRYTGKSTGSPSAVGVDCSGFVSRCWKLPSHYSTRMMDDAITLPYDDWEQTKAGDAAHKVGHVRMIVEHNPDGTITMVESAGYNWRVSYRAYSYAALYEYTPRYYINMVGTPGNIPQPHLNYVLNGTEQNINWAVTETSDLTELRLYKSGDPRDWSGYSVIDKNQTSIALAAADSSCHFYKISSIADDAQQTESLPSDVYGAYGSNVPDKVLIVDGFDRTALTTGSWNHSYHAFAADYGILLHDLGIAFETAANDAVISGQIDLDNYQIVIWFVGDESTADESLNAAEQQIIMDYLENGGKLFVSGSEIAWDLDYRGEGADLYFFANYLKAEYIEDDSESYTVKGAAGTPFTAINFSYDDGTHGIYEEDYPDVIGAAGGANIALYYGNNKPAAIFYQGTFGASERTAKLFYLGLPFETIYNFAEKKTLLASILQFFDYPLTAISGPFQSISKRFILIGNSPNPFNNQTRIHYMVPVQDRVELTVFNTLGQIVYSKEWQSAAGLQSYILNTGNWSSGSYFYRMDFQNEILTNKFILLR